MQPEDFCPRFDAKHRVLLLTIGPRLTKDIYMSAYGVVKRFVAAQGSSSVIMDFSTVTKFDISSEFLREIAMMAPAAGPGRLRVAVAPQPVVYGSGRVVETLAADTVAPVRVVRTLDEAYAMFGAAAADFAAIDPI